MVCLTAREPETPFWKAGVGVWGISSGIILANFWTGWISRPGADGLLHVGVGYPFLVWGTTVFYLVNLVFLFWKRKQMKQRQAEALAEAMILMIFGIVMQNVCRIFLAVGGAAALMLAVLYLTLQNSYAYVDFVTHVLNADYFQYWIEEKFRLSKDVF